MGSQEPSPRKPQEAPIDTSATLKKKLSAFRQQMKLEVEALRKISEKALGKDNTTSSPFEEEVIVEPLQMGQRVVLRAIDPASIKTFVKLHKLYKNDTIRATSLLSLDDPSTNTKMYAFDRCVIRSEFEE